MNVAPIKFYDERRDIVKLSSKQAALEFSVEHFIELANSAIEDRGYFSVALSGGTTPKAIFELLTHEKNKNRLDWSRVLLFWSDERAVPPNDLNSNYRMAMEAGFDKMPISPENIFRMGAEGDIEQKALEYEKLIEHILPGGIFDLVMLGMGEDGHTASLFPETHALKAEENRLVVANYIPKLSAWRMTLTYACINRARSIAIYVIGGNKEEVLTRVFSEKFIPDILPIQKIGTESNKALWIIT